MTLAWHQLSYKLSMSGFLTGPSAGVDPVSRRALWEILLERKADLAILLVTHYTDEADILSDQVKSHSGLCPLTPWLALSSKSSPCMSASSLYAKVQ